MKKAVIALAILGICIYFISCNKNTSPGYFSCTGIAAANDSSQLLAFAKAYGITPIADTSWLYYQIINQGTGAFPIGSSKITVNYVGKFMNGDNFDSTTTPATFQLDSLITGWQYGLPKIKAGGRIKLLLPSALAFGCTGNGQIPPNSPLYFDVTLISVQ
ncbi:MAG TPA: FKBP-type peptidyl-prolyl cis-trans isomerase [Puia sp.]|jgi:FKBP-type peptidyl-prolyl cis-trans isomerase FkpA|nr:FKBP-type peptidyl-prolyl cis-trans isomerase [Puia sp.]